MPVSVVCMLQARVVGPVMVFPLTPLVRNAWLLSVGMATCTWSLVLTVVTLRLGMEKCIPMALTRSRPTIGMFGSIALLVEVCCLLIILLNGVHSV